MSEILIVLALYIIVSFLGMAALWTVAIKRGVVQAPWFFFWVNRSTKRRPEASAETILWAAEYRRVRTLKSIFQVKRRVQTLKSIFRVNRSTKHTLNASVPASVAKLTEEQLALARASLQRVAMEHAIQIALGRAGSAITAGSPTGLAEEQLALARASLHTSKGMEVRVLELERAISAQFSERNAAALRKTIPETNAQSANFRTMDLIHAPAGH